MIIVGSYVLIDISDKYVEMLKEVAKLHKIEGNGCKFRTKMFQDLNAIIVGNF